MTDRHPVGRRSPRRADGVTPLGCLVVALVVGFVVSVNALVVIGAWLVLRS